MTACSLSWRTCHFTGNAPQNTCPCEREPASPSDGTKIVRLVAMMRRLQRLRRDERGASIIELALVAPVPRGAVHRHRRSRARLFAQAMLEQAAHARSRRCEQYQTSSSSLQHASDRSGDCRRRCRLHRQHGSSADYWLECNGGRQCVETTDFRPVRSGADLRHATSASSQRTFTPMFPLAMLAAGRMRRATFTLHGRPGMRMQ